MHARVPTCIRIVRHARPRILSGYVHAATLPPLPAPATPPNPPPPSTLRSPSLFLSLPRPSRPPPPAGRLPPSCLRLLSPLSPDCDGSRRQRTIYAQLHPNYRNGTTPWVQMVHTGVNCHGPREPRFFDRLLQQPRRCFLRELAAELSVSFSSRSTSPWLWPRLVITHAIHKGQQVGEGGESRWSISRKESSMR